MKRIILAVLPVFVAFVAIGQVQVTMSLTPNPIETAMVDSDFEKVGHGEFLNTATDSVIYKWERTVISKPEEWKTLVCDPNQCYLPTTNSKEFGIEGGGTGPLDVHARPYGIAGTAEVHIRIWEVGNEENFIVGIYTFSATTGTEETLEAQVTIAPNPAPRSFSILNAPSISSVVIYNSMGQVMRTYEGAAASYDIATLPTGLYTVLVNDKVLGTQTSRLMKQ